MNIQNNVVLITGGTSGFGFEFTKQLLNSGNTVIITGRDKIKLDHTKKVFPNVHTFQSDVSNPNSIVELFEKVTKEFPNLNMLINNAGEMRKINLNDNSNDLFNIGTEIDINLLGPIRMVQQFLPHLKIQKQAIILNVTSGLALVPFPISPIYGASKSGLHSYTVSLRVQLKNSTVKIFELLAPATKTPLNDKFKGDVDAKTFMDVEKLIALAIKGLEKDQFEIYPGVSKALKIMSRLAPDFILKQLSKPVDKMLRK